MAKEPIYYALLRDCWPGLQIFAVTSENAVYASGRNEHGAGVRILKSRLRGKFKTEPAAKRAISGYRDIEVKHKPFITEAEDKLKNLKKARERELNAYIEQIIRQGA